MQTRERAHCARSVFPFIKKPKKKNAGFPTCRGPNNHFSKENKIKTVSVFTGKLAHIIKRTDRGASTFYFKNFCPRPRVSWFVHTITLESLNQCEPNFHA